MTDINTIRNEINRINTQLVKLFEERIELVKKIADYKIDNNLDVFDKQREKDVKNKVKNIIEDEQNSIYINNFIEEVMAISRQYQKNYMKSKDNKCNKCSETNSQIKIAGFPGIEGSYSEQAFHQYFKTNKNIDKIACSTFEQVIEKLLNHEIDAGILPIENSSTGTVSHSLDLIRDNEINIIGEEIVFVEHNLCAIQGTDIKDIESVYSHPQAIKQCREFLNNYSWNKVSYENTATSAKYVMEQKNKKFASICSKRAAEIYNLDIIKSNINTRRNNYTRFVVISLSMKKNELANKLSMTFKLPNKEGALFNALEIFYNNNINLLKLESRPEPEKPWEYCFFIDAEGNVDDINVINAIKQLDNVVMFKRILGNYISYDKKVNKI